MSLFILSKFLQVQQRKIHMMKILRILMKMTLRKFKNLIVKVFKKMEELPYPQKFMAYITRNLTINPKKSRNLSNK